jgi:hypothetical protein
MATYIQAHKEIVNGQVVVNEVLEADYDGKQMNINLYDQGKHYSTKLNKQEIEHILAKKAHPLALDKRLVNDFDMKKLKTKTKTNTKTNSKTKTKTKTNSKTKTNTKTNSKTKTKKTKKTNRTKSMKKKY